MSFRMTVITLSLLFIAGPLHAHTLSSSATGLMAGFLHPLMGIDHFLAIFAVGFLAIQQKNSATWSLPLAFLLVMILGGILGAQNLNIPFVELGISGSVLILGLIIAFGKKMPLITILPLVATMAFFHGHAHGTEMPLNLAGTEYGIGFSMATILVLGLGIVCSVRVGKLLNKAVIISNRIVGALISVVGVVLCIS